MPRLPRLTAQELLRALYRDGWQERPSKGSHVHLVHPTKPGHVTVSRHGSATLKAGLIAGVLRQAGIDADDLRRLLD